MATGEDLNREKLLVKQLKKKKVVEWCPGNHSIYGLFTLHTGSLCARHCVWLQAGVLGWGPGGAEACDTPGQREQPRHAGRKGVRERAEVGATPRSSSLDFSQGWSKRKAIHTRQVRPGL